MKVILILGAGRSSSALIQYLLEHSGAEDWKVRVGDLDPRVAEAKIGGHSRGEFFAIRQDDNGQREAEISAADLVISMLPAPMHPAVAEVCIRCGKNLITPSYISEEMQALHAAAVEKGVMLLNEMGVDPGIDHMSAAQILDGLRRKGAVINSFESFTGGLIAPACDNNPWHYKITWNPRNVVLAGAGVAARYYEGGIQRYVPYHQLFRRITTVDVPGHGKFEGYANRDSVKYRVLYGLDNIPTLIRGTLRRDGYCAAWNVLVQIGLTDDSVEIPNPSSLSWRQLTASFLPESASARPEDFVKEMTGADTTTMAMLTWLGIFEERPLGIDRGSPAAALQKLIEERWILSPGDRDMIVMWHRFGYALDGQNQWLESWLVTEGIDETYTAMARTVGLPIAIAARHLMNGTLFHPGVIMPMLPDIYQPVLDELNTLGICFHERIQ
ncbi:MAG: saccharopine dehydrogenase NADP-binding domain-containing protein [Flavobacteriales bacterium]|nr:saccharopine dehydrogenase NADP-binding domain-containing protein [Flavobacteriales bacterium]